MYYQHAIQNKTMITKLPYGLREGKLVSIKDVEKGLACKCICPSCERLLIARKGDSRIHHFAHYKGESCEHGIETALHLAAKEIIQEKKVFTIPSLIITDGYGFVKLSEKKRLELEEVQSEIYIGDFKPDIVAKIRGKKTTKDLIIEIAVTHFVDESKLKKIKSEGISAIEVDLSELKDGFSKKDLIELVIESVKNKKWIFNAKKSELLDSYIQKRELQYKLEEEKRKNREREASAKEKAMKQRKHEATRNRFDIINCNQDGESSCPMIILERSKYMKNNEIISELRKGKLWNGNIYGQGPNGRYVFIEGKKKEIFPKDSEFNLTEQEHQSRKKIYGQLRFISEKSRIDYEKCEECQYFGEDLDDSSFSCGFRKENKLK